MKALYLLLLLFISSCGNNATQTFKTVDISNIKSQLQPEVKDLFLINATDADSQGVNLYIAPKNVSSEAYTMMYYGNLFAGILAHAAFEGVRQESRASDEYKKSNSSLAKHRKDIKAISNKFILNKALGNYSKFNLTTNKLEADIDSWRIKIAPDFVISNNKNEISIIARISLSKNDKEQNNLHSKTIFVQSNQPIHSIDKLFINNALHLKKTLSVLVFSAVDLFIKDSIGVLAREEKLKTIKYTIDSKKIVERGKIIFKNCDSIIFESLRKEIKLVVTKNINSCEKS